MPQNRPKGNNCGLCCFLGLLLSVTSFSVGIVVLCISPDNPLTAILDQTNKTTNSSEVVNEIVALADIVDGLLLLANIVTVIVIYWGFSSLLKFQSNYWKFTFTDVFYCLCCLGSVVLLSFSVIAVFAVNSDTEILQWSRNSTTENSEEVILFEQLVKAGPKLSNMSVFSIVFTVSQLLQVFLSSSFVIHATQMLPHGDLCVNKPVRQVVQFVGMIHFFLWVTNSFIYSPQVQYFYPVELFYFGSTFGVIAKLTYPLVIFYHFTTALRCFDLNIKYNSMP